MNTDNNDRSQQTSNHDLTHEQTSLLLHRVLDELQGDEVKIGLIVRKLKGRSYGGLMLLLGALALLPGISLFAGLALCLPAIQMMLGYPAPLLPRVIRQHKVKVKLVKNLGIKTTKAIEWAEDYVRPRWLPMSALPVPNIIGGLTLGLAVMVMLPLPFINFPAALALLCLAVGLLERDGLVIAAALSLSTFVLMLGGIITYFAAESFALFIDKHFQ